MTDQKIDELLNQLGDPEESWFHTVQIRQAVKADLQDLEWEGEYQRFRKIYSEVFRRTQNGLALIWVAALPKAGVVGQVFVQLISGRRELANGRSRAYVHSFRVRSQCRGRGLGSRLMVHVEDDLIQRGYDEVTLNVTKDNQGAIRLYQRLGYSIISRDPGRWSYIDENSVLREVHEPGWRMRKEFS